MFLTVSQIPTASAKFPDSRSIEMTNELEERKRLPEELILVEREDWRRREEANSNLLELEKTAR